MKALRIRVALHALIAAALASGGCGHAANVVKDEDGVLGKLESDKQELARLKRDILKVDKSVEVTKALINRSKGERYLPDLYFRLAELYIEKSRLVYFRILEEAGAEDKAAVVAPEARLLKDQAIAVYRRILSEFPDYPDNDKITFFIAHEYRELGNFQEMIKTYEELISKFPKSNFRYEAWLILGDYHFDKGDIDEAIQNYRAILKNPETYAHNMARYKLAWCYINKDKTNLAVDLWEQAVRTPTPPEPGTDQTVGTLADKPPRLDVREDALRDLAYYYAEARDPKTALSFFQDLCVSRAEYKMALEKLAKRFQIKTMYDESAKVYRELIRISADVDRDLEWAEAVYEAAVAARDLAHADEDVIMLSEVSARYKYWWRASEDDKKVLKDFELLTRDLSTRLHALAKDKNDPDLYARAAKAYDAYLSVFDDSPERLAMEWNYAETLFAAKKFVQAGREYEQVLKDLSGGNKPKDTKKIPDEKVPLKKAKVADAKDGKDGKGDVKNAKDTKDAKKAPPAVKGPQPSDLAKTSGSVEGDKKQAMYSAILSYFEALKNAEKGTRFDSMMAREGIKDLGAKFVAKYPTDPNTPNVKFNVARAYYEQGLYDKAIELFAAFVKEHPTNKDANTAAELALDSYSQKEDFMGLAKQAREFSKIPQLSDPAHFNKMASDAEQEEINRKTIESQGGKVADELKGFIKAHKGDEIAAKALYQAFVIARDRRNVEDMRKTGEQLLSDYQSTKYAREVLPSLAEQAIRVSQIEKAAELYERYARMFPNGQGADDLLEGAAQIRAGLGEFTDAMSDYDLLTKQGDQGRRPQWYAELAKLAVRSGDWRRAENASLAIADNGAHAVLANTIAGEAALREAKADVAADRLNAAVVAASKGRGGDDGSEWLARAQYLLGELVRQQFEQVQFGVKDEGSTLQDKFQLLQELQATYVAAIQVGDPEWAMGGLYRIANAYKQAADFLDNAPAPQGASPDEEKQYRAALAERSGPLRKQAAEALQACREQAKKLEAFNRFTKACMAGAQVKDDEDNPKARPPGVAIPNRDQLEAKLVENPKDLPTLTQLIRAAISVKDYPLAHVLAGRAIEIDDRSASLVNLDGVALFGANEMQAAAAQFKKATKLDSRYGAAWANLGTLYATYGNADKAREAFFHAGSFDANAPDVVPGAAAAKGGR